MGDDAHGAQDLSSIALRAVGMLDLLNGDRRPTFVIDLETSTYRQFPLQPVFYNVSMRSYNDLYATVCAEFTPDTFQTIGQAGTAFTQWASKCHDPESLAYSPITFNSLAWDVITVKNRWNVVSANLATRQHRTSIVQSQAASRQKKSESLSSHSASSNALQSQMNTSTADSSTRPSTVARKEPETYDVKTSYQLANADNVDNDSVSNEPNLDIPSADQVSTGHLYQATINIPASHYTRIVTELQDQTQVAIRNARLLDRVSCFESVGIYMVDAKGDIDFCNETWYRLTGHPKQVVSALAWMNVWHEEDLPRINQIWQEVMIDFKAIHFEGRFNTPWKPPFHVDGEPDTSPTWIRAYSYPEVSEDGVFLGASGCLIDISEQKWVERLQSRKMDEALEHTRLLEALNKKQAEAAAIQLEAAASEIRFRRLADLMPMSIFMANKDRQLIYANEAYHDLFAGVEGKQAAESWMTAIHADDIGIAQESWTKLIEEKVSVTFEARLTEHQGVACENDGFSVRQKWVLVSAYAEVNNDGLLQHIIGCVTDISKLKEAEQVQMQRVFDVTQAKNQQEAFIDMTSHEIRNPLSSIVHCADEISDHLNGMTLTPEKQRTISIEEHNSARVAAQTILFCTEHLKRIVDDILTLSKINSKLLQITPTTVDPKSSALQALNMFDREMRNSEIQVHFHADESIALLGVEWAYLDQLRVLQILVNLVGNSVKFTQQQELRQVRVSIHASNSTPLEDDNDGLVYLNRILAPSEAVTNIKPYERIYIKYTVQDTGCGISADGQKALFSRFTQDSNKTHIKYGGNGLGLFISRQLCELHGGQMGFKSIEGQGSTFSFFILTRRTTPAVNPTSPGRTYDPLQNGTNANSIKSPSGTYKPAASERSTPEQIVPNVPQVHVLLVEDNMINQRVLSQQLKKRGYSVSIANHGEEALSYIQTTHFWAGNGSSGGELSVVLLDNEMPVMDGLTCIRRIRELQADGRIIGHIPVIAVTANARPQQVEDALAAGMDHVVSKPFRMPELVNLITRII